MNDLKKGFSPVDLHERPINFLVPKEINSLLQSAKKSRYGVRNYLAVLMLYRHALRESELCNLKLSDLCLDSSMLWVNRLKGSLSTQQPICGDELRVIRRYLRERERNQSICLPWLFVSERFTQLSRHTVIYLVRKAGVTANLGRVTPHMLRHSCGFYLANKGYDQRLIQDYLGHRNPSHTSIYTRTAAHRFNGLWR